MDDPELIRKQMEETRTQLSEKLETLESQLSETVQSTSTAVSETVEAVKDTVESVTETFQSAGEFLDIRRQTDRHPWLVVGGAVAVGFVASRFLFGRRSKPVATVVAGAAAAEPAAAQTSWIARGLTGLRGLAVGVAMDVVRDIAARGLPGTVVPVVPPVNMTPMGVAKPPQTRVVDRPLQPSVAPPVSPLSTSTEESFGTPQYH